MNDKAKQRVKNVCKKVATVVGCATLVVGVAGFVWLVKNGVLEDDSIVIEKAQDCFIVREA